MWCRRSVLPSRHASPSLGFLSVVSEGARGHTHLDRMFTTKVRSKKESSCHDARNSAAPDVRSCSTAARRIRAVVGSERGRHESGRTHAERGITNRRAQRGCTVAARPRGGSSVMVPESAPFFLLFPATANTLEQTLRAAAAGAHTGRLRAPVPETPVAANAPPPEPACPYPAQTAPATSPSPCAHRSECRSERACSLLALAGPQGSTMGALVSKLLNTLLGNKEVRVLILGLDNAGKTLC